MYCSMQLIKITLNHRPCMIVYMYGAKFNDEDNNYFLSHDDVIDQRLGCAGKRVTSTAVTT